MVIDPADSDDGESEWGVAIGGAYRGDAGTKIHVNYLGGFMGQAYEGDLWDDSIYESIWRQIFDIAKEFDVRTVLLEGNLVAAIRACHRYIYKAGVPCNVVEIRVKGRKITRIVNGLDQPINNGMVSANEEVLDDQENMRQLARLKYNRLPKPCDRLDALSSLIGYIMETDELSVRSALTDSAIIDSGHEITTIRRLHSRGRALGATR